MKRAFMFIMVMAIAMSPCLNQYPVRLARRHPFLLKRLVQREVKQLLVLFRHQSKLMVAQLQYLFLRHKSKLMGTPL